MRLRWLRAGRPDVPRHGRGTRARPRWRSAVDGDVRCVAQGPGASTRTSGVSTDEVQRLPPPAQSQTPTARAHLTGAELGGTPTGGPRQPPRTAVARNAAYLRPQAADQPRAAHTALERRTRRRNAPLRPATLRHLITARGGTEASTRPRNVERARVMGAHRPGKWPVALPAPQPLGWRVAPDSAPEVERPWNRRIVNDTGV